MIESIYVIGSLRNPKIPVFGNRLRELGYDVFDHWWGAGEKADDAWKEYSLLKGFTYAQALKDYGAKHVFEFDKMHLDRCDAAVLLMPAGKSGHTELGYTIGKGKPGWIVFEEEPPNDRWDCMIQLASGIFFNVEKFIEFARILRD